MMGVTPDQLSTLVQTLDPQPVAYGANCGVGASELIVALKNMGEVAASRDVLIAKSNCGIPEWSGDQIVYSGTPELMADYTRLAIDCGARIVGGCCGTTPEHIRVMRKAMDAHTRRAAPELETIVAQLGEISTGATDQAKRGPLGDLPESEAASASGKRRRGRRRAASETPGF